MDIATTTNVVLLMIATSVLYFLYRIGIFTSVHVVVGKPVIQNAWIAYKYYTGPYMDCGPAFKDVMKTFPNMTTVGIFYDDPNTTPKEKLRYALGIMMSEDGSPPTENLIALATSNQYAIMQLPEIKYAVKTKFPHTLDIVPFVAPMKVYPAMGKYIKVYMLLNITNIAY
ncbi:unnamed protein product [Clavelina lepadiformis]|uniref:Cytochrome P450 n=1 Tax=Clavelina lepadiformis TaxID=159417 RepID=A0ABP0H2H4_CLALP